MKVLRLVLSNPLNRRNRIAALIRFFKWQFGSLLVSGKVLIPWINGSRIFAGFMMSGSAGCAYSGLHEFEEMAFVLHCLRKDDLFMDVGANVGVFTVLAGSAIGASCVSVEPSDESYSHLQDNIVVNGMQDRVQSIKACISNEDAVCRFSTSAESTLSHIASSNEEENTSEIDTRRIDTILDGRIPTILKVDVEGYEKQAIEGATKTFADEGLKAVLLEIGSHSLRYEVQPVEIHNMMLEHGFHSYTYEPYSRTLMRLDSFASGDNTLYLRDVDFVLNRLRDGSSFSVFGQKL